MWLVMKRSILGPGPRGSSPSAARPARGAAPQPPGLP
jgi:hypothetical protein